MSRLRQVVCVTRRKFDGPVVVVGFALALVGWCLGHCMTYHVLGMATPAAVGNDGIHVHRMPMSDHWYMWNIWKYGLVALAAAILAALTVAVRQSTDFSSAIRQRNRGFRDLPWFIAMGFPAATWCIVEFATRAAHHEGLPPVGLLLFGAVVQLWIGAACLLLLRFVMRAITTVATWLVQGILRTASDAVVVQQLIGTTALGGANVPVLATPRGPPRR